MQTASRAYKNSIRQIGRNRGFIKVTIGVINSDAQKNVECKESENQLFYLANTKKIFSGYSVSQPYATCEQNLTKVNGTHYFAPMQNNNALYNNGIISEDVLGAIKITFGAETSLDIKGLMIDFSDCYPTEFTIENDEETKTYENNSRYFQTEDVFDSTSFLTITPTTMVNGQGRLRIYGITCGIANTFTNDDVIDYSNKEYVSPLSETIPSTDVSLTVNNANQYYSPDDPTSALSYMEIGQEVKVSFGYDVDGDGEIEWLPEQTTYLQSWRADNEQASFTATDRFNYFNGTYYKGRYNSEGISLYDLAVDVLTDMGIDSSEYFVDSYLENVIVHNPIPPVTHSSALQIIANAGRCVLSEDRDGRINIRSSFIPEMTAYATDETDYSHAENVLGGTNIQNYAEASKDFSKVDGTYLFYGTPSIQNTAYISEEVADTNGNFVNNPQLTIALEATFSPYSFGISFNGNHPSEIKVSTYVADVLVDEFTDDVADSDYRYENSLNPFDRMIIEVTKGYAHSRVFIDSVTLGTQSDYLLKTNHELTEYPIAQRQTKLKSISINRSNYRKSSEQKNLSTEKLLLDAEHNTHTVYFSNPTYNCTVNTEGSIVPYPYYHSDGAVINGIKWNYNSDGALRASGTLTTSDSKFYLCYNQAIVSTDGTYKLSGGVDSQHIIYVYDQDAHTTAIYNNGGISTGTLYASHKYSIIMQVWEDVDDYAFPMPMLVDSNGIIALITDYSDYFVKMTFSGLTEETEVEYSLNGSEYIVDNQTVVVEHNAKGEEKTWNNPLISSVEMAKDLEEWLANFYLGDLEYEVTWRGDPRVDANDLFHLETRMGNVPIRGYENTLSFSNSGWSGRMKARKIVE